MSNQGKIENKSGSFDFKKEISRDQSSMEIVFRQSGLPENIKSFIKFDFEPKEDYIVCKITTGDGYELASINVNHYSLSMVKESPLDSYQQIKTNYGEIGVALSCRTLGGINHQDWINHQNKLLLKK